MPALSVILSTPDCFETIRATASCVSQQSIADQIELVIVCPDAAALALDAGGCGALHSVQVVEFGGALSSVGNANALGVLKAHAPVVALAEDHCFPQSGWAVALLARHSGQWAAVGPVFINANPENGVSDADLLMAYGPFMQGCGDGPVPFLPGHNSSYKRETLLKFGAQLPELMSAEYNLHQELRSSGEGLYCEPAAVVAHTNFSRWQPFLGATFLSARHFAGCRGGDWSLLKRLLYVAASPLIPLVRLRRIAMEAMRARLPLPRLVACTPALFTGLVASALGEAAGYIVGCLNSDSRLVYYEFHRYRHTLSGRPVAEAVPTLLVNAN